MSVTARRLSSAPAYKWGGFALVIAAAAIIVALGSEHLGGVAPCPLCLEQRWAYYGGIPLLFLALVLYSTGQRVMAGWIFFIVTLAFLANAGLGVYHAGVEWKYWPGPTTCTGNALTPLVGGSGQGVLGGLADVQVIRCDEAPIRIFGLSMAGWNVISSLVIMAAALKAAMASATHDPI